LNVHNKWCGACARAHTQKYKIAKPTICLYCVDARVRAPLCAKLSLTTMNMFLASLTAARSIARTNPGRAVHAIWVLLSTKRARCGNFSHHTIDSVAKIVPWGKLLPEFPESVPIFRLCYECGAFRFRNTARQIVHSGVLCAVRCGLFFEAFEMLRLSRGYVTYELSFNQEAFVRYAASRAAPPGACPIFQLPRKLTHKGTTNTMAFLFERPADVMSAAYITAVLKLLADQTYIHCLAAYGDCNTKRWHTVSVVEILAHCSKLAPFDVVGKWLLQSGVQSALCAALCVDELGVHASGWKQFSALPLDRPVMRRSSTSTSFKDPRCYHEELLINCTVNKLHETKLLGAPVFVKRVDDASGQVSSRTHCSAFNALRTRSARVMQVVVRWYWEHAFLCFSWRPTPGCLSVALAVKIVDDAPPSAEGFLVLLDDVTKLKIAQSARDAYAKMCAARNARVRCSRKRKRARSL